MTVSKASVPFANYGVLSGQMFLYAGGRAAFESPLPTEIADTTNSGHLSSVSSKKCILLGGLSDGLLPVPYTQILADACHENSWSLVQPVISSSYTGFGHGSLKRDCDELQELMRYLIEYREAEEFCLVGHSTGCQDAVYFLANSAEELCSKVSVVALQAPVSDREGASSYDGYAENLELAQKLVQEKKEDEMMPRSAFWAPITAQRFIDLNARGGADDFFSSDYSDDELAGRLRHVGSSKNKDLRVLVAFSGADEYVPKHIDREKLNDRLVAAMNVDCLPENPTAEALFLKSGNHNLSKGPDDGKTFVKRLASLLLLRS